MLFSWAGSGCGVLWAADATWSYNSNSGNWTQYQGHDLTVVVSTYRPKSASIANSDLISVTTDNVPISQYGVSNTTGFYYKQDSANDTISFYCLYCADLDRFFVRSEMTTNSAKRVRSDIISSKWYKSRKAREPVTVKLIDTSVIAGLFLQVLKGWFTSALGIIFTLFFLLRGFFVLRDFLNGVQADRAAKWIEQQEKLNGTHKYRRFRNKKALFNHLEKSYKEDVLK